MLALLLLFAIFIPAICFKSNIKPDYQELHVEKAIIPLLAWAIGAALISVAVGVYTFLQMRKMQKKNKPKPNQLDGTIADEGTSFSDIAGSPHMYGNITHLWGQRTKPIKSKGGKK